MTVLVTGAGGFLGQSLCEALLVQGAEVRAVARREPEAGGLPDIDWRVADLGERSVWDGLLEGADTVYHLAWSTTPAGAAVAPAADVAENVVGTLNLLEAAVRGARPRIVFPSSGGAVYGRLQEVPAREDHPVCPISAHGAAKLAVEHYLEVFRTLHGLDTISLRVANPYGVRQDPSKGLGAVSIFARAAVAGEPIVIFGDGRIVRDYVHVDDVVRAMLLVGEQRGLGGVLNIGSGQGRSLLDVVASLEATLGRTLEIRHLPERSFDVPVSILDATRAEEALGWRAQVPFEEGVRRLVSQLSDGA